MIRSIFALLFIFVAISCQKKQEYNAVTNEKKSPHDFMFMQRAYPTGSIDTKAASNALKKVHSPSFKKQSGIPWMQFGPTNIGGRITDIEIPVDQAQTYYIGAASGGVFKSIDAGASWNPIFDEQNSLSIGDITISTQNSNTVWVGTGEVNAGGGSLAYDGVGLLKSEDGGVTWESRGLEDVGSIGKILIDPDNDDNLLVAAMGPLFRNDSNRGVYKTTDGGITWEQTLFVNDITGAIDMAMHPTDGAIAYAATWQRVRRPQFREYGGAGSGLYKTTDGGSTWVEMTNGLPLNPNDKGRISIAVAPSNPDYLYARYADATGNIQGVYRSTNAGDSWVTMNSAPLINVGFHWWFRGIVVDPSDENTIYNVDFQVQKSINGGASWFDSFQGVHVDQHAMAFNTMVDGEVLLGNDGGFYKSGNDGASWQKDGTLPITQLYRMTVDPSNSERIYTGAQDNSTMRTFSEPDEYNIINGGDGFQPIVDFNDSNIIYALSQNGFLRKSTNNAVNFQNATNGINPSDRNNWDTPVVMSHFDSQKLYYGTQRVWQTTNGAQSWTAISPDLTNGSGNGNISFGTITSIDVSPADDDVIYVGTDDGNVWVTTNGGDDWVNISSTLPERWVTSVKTIEFSPNVVAVTFSGYRYGEDDGHIYLSTDYGATWENKTGNLPDVPVNDIEFATFEGTFVATDIGVFTGELDTGNWEYVVDGIPPVVITDLHYQENNSFIYAATYGRSIYGRYAGEVGVEEVDLEEFKIFPNPANALLNIKFNTPIHTQGSIYSMLGKKVLQFDLKSDETQINVSGLQSGIYFLAIDSSDAFAVQKLIIK